MLEFIHIYYLLSFGIYIAYAVLIRLDITFKVRNILLTVLSIVLVLPLFGYYIYCMIEESFFFNPIFTLYLIMAVPMSLMYMYPSEVAKDALKTKRAKKYMEKRQMFQDEYIRFQMRGCKIVGWCLMLLTVLPSIDFIIRTQYVFETVILQFICLYLTPIVIQILVIININAETKSAYMLQSDASDIDITDNVTENITENVTESEVPDENASITKKRGFYCCARCGRPMSVFDMLFYQKLRNEKDKNKCQCFVCTSNYEFRSIINDLDNPLSAKCIIAHLLPAIFFLIGLMFYHLDETSMTSVEDIWMLSWAITAISSIVCGIIVVRGLGLDYSTWKTGSHYESTIKEDGKISTEKVDDYSYGSGHFWAPILVVTFIIWSIPHMIYLYFKQVVTPNMKYQTEVPEPVRRAYDSTRQYNKTFSIPAASRTAYAKQLKDYDSAVYTIEARYSMLGDNEVTSRVSRLLEPYLLTTFNGTRAVMVSESGYRENGYRHDFQFLMYIDGEGRFQGVTLIDGKMMYSETDYMDAWRELALIKNIDKTVAEAKAYLKKQLTILN